MKKVSKFFLGAISVLVAAPVFADPLVAIDYNGETVSSIVVKAIGFLLDFAGAVAVLFIIYAGFLFITASGNKERLEQAKKTLIFAVIGVIVIVLSSFIVTFVSTNVTNTIGDSSDTGAAISADVMSTESELAHAVTVPPAQATYVAATDAAQTQTDIESMNNADGEFVSIEDQEADDAGTPPANDVLEPEAKDTTSAFLTPILNKITQNPLISPFVSVGIADASGGSAIKTKITYGTKGKFTVLADSKATNQKQYDSRWRYKKYGTASACSAYGASACGASSLANALSAYVKSLTPYSIGTLIGHTKKYNYIRNTYKGCKSGTNSLGIPVIGSLFVSTDGYKVEAKSATWAQAQKAINESKPVIFRSYNDAFTTQGHYLVVRGKVKRKSDNKIFYWISDSGGRNITAAEPNVVKTGGDTLFWIVTKTDVCVKDICKPKPVVKLAAPAALPVGGQYSAAQTVTVTPPADAVSTYYTLDGTAPDKTKTAYTDPVTVNGEVGTTITLKVASYDKVGNIGEVASLDYAFVTPPATDNTTTAP